MTELQKKKMIKLIHTQKTRAGIDDEAYCCILMGSAGVQSSLDMQTEKQFKSVIKALNNLLAAQGKAPLGGYYRPAVPRNVYPLVKRAEKLLGTDMEKRFGGYIKKPGKNSANDLTPEEIRKCHGFLSRIEQWGDK